MGTLIASAAAKLLLSGEHSVLKGMPAAGLPLPLHITLYLTPAPRFELIASARHHEALALYPAFRDAIWRLLCKYGAARSQLMIRSSIPLSSGLGSSAALCIACAKIVLTLRSLSSRARRRGNPPVRIEAETKEIASARGVPSQQERKLWRLAHELERHFHATPSGVETGIIALNRAVLFMRQGSARMQNQNSARKKERMQNRKSTRRQERAQDQNSARNKQHARLKSQAIHPLSTRGLPYARYHAYSIAPLRATMIIIVLPRRESAKEMIARIGRHTPQRHRAETRRAEQPAEEFGITDSDSGAGMRQPLVAQSPWMVRALKARQERAQAGAHKQSAALASATAENAAPTPYNALPPERQPAKEELAMSDFCRETLRFAHWLASLRCDSTQREYEQGYAIIRALHRAQQLLGISTAELDAFIAYSIACGAAAGKVSGAGGGGSAFVLFPDRAQMEAACAPILRFSAERYTRYHLYRGEVNGERCQRFSVMAAAAEPAETAEQSRAATRSAYV